MSERFDVFLSYNRRDHTVAHNVARALRARGLRVWLDEWELVPGRPWQEALERALLDAGSSAILVGGEGLGRWEEPEMRVSVDKAVRRKAPVIPVFLPGALRELELPSFLAQFQAVDLRDGIDEEGVDRLVWGVTGTDPGVAALARQMIDETDTARTQRAASWDVFLVHQPADAAAVAELGEKLRRRGSRVATTAEGWQDRLEEILGSTRRVAAVVGRQRPWDDDELGDLLALFARRGAALVPVRLQDGGPVASLPDGFAWEPWVELDADFAGVERLEQAGAPAAAPKPARGEAFAEERTGTRFLWILGGRFRMGSTAWKPTQPVHEVRVSPFWLAETPVTNRQYAVFLRATGHEEPSLWRDRRFSAEEQPVVRAWHFGGRRPRRAARKCWDRGRPARLAGRRPPRKRKRECGAGRYVKSLQRFASQGRLQRTPTALPTKAGGTPAVPALTNHRLRWTSTPEPTLDGGRRPVPNGTRHTLPGFRPAL